MNNHGADDHLSQQSIQRLSSTRCQGIFMGRDSIIN